MLAFIAQINRLRLWHIDELMALRNSIIMALLVPLGFMILATLTGGWSFGLKKFLILAGMSYGTFRVIQLSARRAVIATEIATVIEKKQLTSLVKVSDLIDGARAFIEMIGRIITAQITVLLLTLVMNGHRDPVTAFIVIFIGIGLMTWTLTYVKDGQWWPTFALWTMITTMVVMVAPLLYPSDEQIAITLGWKIGSYRFPTAGWFGERYEVIFFVVAIVMMLIVMIVAAKKSGPRRVGTVVGAAPAVAARPAASAEHAGGLVCIGTILAGLLTIGFVMMWSDSGGRQVMYFWAVLAGVAATVFLGMRGKDSKKALAFMCLGFIFVAPLFLVACGNFLKTLN